MGRQICFFVTEKDVQELFKVIERNGGIVVDSHLNRVDSVKENKAFVILPNSRLCFFENSNKKVLNQLFSEIIEFSVSNLNTSLENINCGYEYGRFWCETSYYDSLGNKIEKSQEFISLYVKLKRFVIRNFRISNNKQWYIAPDAYKKYLDGLFVPCSGKTVIDFGKTRDG